MGNNKYTLELIGNKGILTGENEKILLEIDKRPKPSILITEENTNEKITLRPIWSKEKEERTMYEISSNNKHNELKMAFLLLLMITNRSKYKVFKKPEEIIVENKGPSYNDEEKQVKKERKTILVKNILKNSLVALIGSGILFWIFSKILYVMKFKSDTFGGIAISISFSTILVLFLAYYMSIINKDATEYYAMLTLESKRNHAMTILGLGAIIFMGLCLELDYLVMLILREYKLSNTWLTELMVIVAIGLIISWIILDYIIYIAPLKHFYNKKWTKTDENLMWTSIIMSILILIGIVVILPGLT